MGIQNKLYLKSVSSVWDKADMVPLPVFSWCAEYYLLIYPHRFRWKIEAGLEAHTRFVVAKKHVWSRKSKYTLSQPYLLSGSKYSQQMAVLYYVVSITRVNLKIVTFLSWKCYLRNLIKSRQSKEKDGPILGVRLAILYKRLVPPDLCVWNKGQHKLVARLIIQLRTILTRGSKNTITNIKTNPTTYLFVEPILLPLSPSIKAISTY